MVYLTNIKRSCYFFLDYRFKHTFHGFLHILNGIINDGIKTNFHTFLIGLFTSHLTGTNLETDNHSLRSSRQSYVVFRNLSYALMDNVYHNLFGRKFNKRIAQSLNGTINVTLDNNVQFLERA